MNNYFFLQNRYIKCAPNRKIKSEEDTCFSIDILEDMLNELKVRFIENHKFPDETKNDITQSLALLSDHKKNYIENDTIDNAFKYKMYLYDVVKKILQQYIEIIQLKYINLNDIDFSNEYNWLKLPIFEHLFYKYNIHDIFTIYNTSIFDEFKGVHQQFYETIMDKYEQLYPEFKYILVKRENGMVTFKDIYNDFVDIIFIINSLDYYHTKLNKSKFGFLVYSNDTPHAVALYMDLYKLQIYYQNSWGTPPNDVSQINQNDRLPFLFINNIINQLYRYMMSFYTNYNTLYMYIQSTTQEYHLNEYYVKINNTIIQQRILLYLLETLCDEYKNIKQEYDKQQKSMVNNQNNTYTSLIDKYTSLIDKYISLINISNINLNTLNEYNTLVHDIENYKDKIDHIEEIHKQINEYLNNIIEHINKREYIKKNNKIVRTDKRMYIDNCIQQIYDQIKNLQLNKRDKIYIFNTNMQIINKFFDIRYNNIGSQFRYGICTIYAITFIVRLVEGVSFDNFKNIHETNDDMAHYTDKYLTSF